MNKLGSFIGEKSGLVMLLLAILSFFIIVFVVFLGAGFA